MNDRAVNALRMFSLLGVIALVVLAWLFTAGILQVVG